MRELGDATASVELAQVPANLALVTDDPRHRSQLFSDAIEQLTWSVGSDHPLTLDTRIKSALNTDDAVAAGEELAAACTLYRELHPQHGAAIGHCAYELGGHELDRGDSRAAREWFAAVVATEAHGGDGTVIALARAHVLRLDGGHRDALAAFDRVRAQIGSRADGSWWLRVLAAEADLGAGLAARDAGDRATARSALARATAALEEIVAIKPNAARVRVLERARRERATL